MQGKPSSGFEFEIKDEILDDFEIFESLCKIDKGEFENLVPVMKEMLGEDQEKKFREHLRNKENGRISLQKVMEEFNEMLSSGKEGKNF